jgi:SAM-dependent methyltransferase
MSGQDKKKKAPKPKGKLDPYHEFAERYDFFFTHWQQFDQTYVTFFRTLFNDHDVEHVLDCACGTGRDLHLFHSLGFSVCGSDASGAMLARAKENLSSRGIEVPLDRRDFRTLQGHERAPFDAVACLSTSLPHLMEDDDIVRALESMWQVLRKDGLLVLTQGMCDRQMKEKPRFIAETNTRDFSRVFMIDYLEKTFVVNVLDLIHTKKENDFKVSRFTFRLLLKDDYEKLLKRAGFKKIDFYGSYKFEPYNKDESESLIVVAFK